MPGEVIQEGDALTFVEWKPYTNPKTKKSGWVSPGGQVRYTKPPASKDDPKPAPAPTPKDTPEKGKAKKPEPKPIPEVIDPAKALDTVKAALSNPKPSPESVADFAKHAAALSIPQLAALQKEHNAAGGRSRADKVAKLADALKAKLAHVGEKPAEPKPTEPVKEEPKPAKKGKGKATAKPAEPAPVAGIERPKGYDPAKPGKLKQVYADPATGAYLNNDPKTGAMVTPMPDEAGRKELVKQLAPAIERTWNDEMYGNIIQSDGFVPMSMVLNEIKRHAPAGTTTNDIQAAMYQLHKDRKIQLNAVNEAPRYTPEQQAKGGVWADDSYWGMVSNGAAGQSKIDLSDMGGKGPGHRWAPSREVPAPAPVKPADVELPQSAGGDVLPEYRRDPTSSAAAPMSRGTIEGAAGSLKYPRGIAEFRRFLPQSVSEGQLATAIEKLATDGRIVVSADADPRRVYQQDGRDGILVISEQPITTISLADSRNPITPDEFRAALGLQAAPPSAVASKPPVAAPAKVATGRDTARGAIKKIKAGGNPTFAADDAVKELQRTHTTDEIREIANQLRGKDHPDLASALEGIRGHILFEGTSR